MSYAENTITVRGTRIRVLRGGYTKEGIQKGLKEIKDYQGVVGQMSFEKGNVVLLPLRFVKFESGKWTPIPN